MNPVLQLVLGTIIMSLSELARRQVLQGEALGAFQASLDLVGLALTRGTVTMSALQDLNNILVTMVAAGREPSVAEWDHLRQRSADAHAAIQGVSGA